LPEEEEEHLSAVNGSKWKSVVWHFNESIHKELKYTEMTKATRLAYTHLSETLRDILDNYGLMLD
jgi:hypothetical protein